MTYWDDRIKEHPIWSALDRIGPALDEAKKRQDVPMEAIEQIERLRAVLTYLGRKLGSVDRLVANPAPLHSMASSCDQAIAALVAYSTTGDINQLTAANARIDDAMSALPQMPTTASSEDLANIGEIAAQYRKGIEDHLAALTEVMKRANGEAVAVKESLTALRTELSTEATRLETVAADFEKRIADALATNRDSFDQALAAQSKAAADLILSHESEYKEARAKLEKTNLGFLEDQRTTLAARDKEFKADLDKALVEKSREAEKVLLKLKAQQDEVQKTLGAIGGGTISEGYTTAADDAARRMETWQRATVASMLLLIIVAISSFAPALDAANKIPIEYLVAKFLVTLTVAVLAAYCGSQADKQYQAEKRNRRIALEFKALSPFIAPLPEDQQFKFRYEIGDRSFGRGDDGKGNEKSPATIADFFADIRKDPTLTEKAREAFGDLLDRVLPKKPPAP